MSEQQMLVQEAPYPTELARLVTSLTYKPGWYFELKNMDRGQGSVGLTLVVTTLTQDSLDMRWNEEIAYDPDMLIPRFRVNHLFIVPAAAYDRDSWQRWLLDRIIEIETHEACEFFRIKRERVYAPHHGEGEDPYIIWQIGTAEAAAKSFTDK